MDLLGTIFSAINTGLKAIDWAKSKGLLGGSDKWSVVIQAASDGMALLERGKALFAAIIADKDEYDRIEAMPQAAKEAEIQRRLYPTPLADLVAQVRDQMTGGAG